MPHVAGDLGRAVRHGRDVLEEHGPIVRDADDQLSKFFRPADTDAGLDRNGNVRGNPRVTSPRNYTFDPPMRVAVDNAVRAVRACDPYPFPTDPQLGDHYEIWNEIEFTFTPR